MDRVEHHRRTTARSRPQRLAPDQALVFQDPEVIPCGVERDAALLGERAGGASGLLLDDAEQTEPTGMCQSAEVVSATRHVVSVGAATCTRRTFDRK